MNIPSDLKSSEADLRKQAGDLISLIHDKARDTETSTGEADSVIQRYIDILSEPLRDNSLEIALQGANAVTSIIKRIGDLIIGDNNQITSQAFTLSNAAISLARELRTARGSFL